MGSAWLPSPPSLQHCWCSVELSRSICSTSASSLQQAESHLLPHMTCVLHHHHPSSLICLLCKPGSLVGQSLPLLPSKITWNPRTYWPVNFQFWPLQHNVWGQLLLEQLSNWWMRQQPESSGSVPLSPHQDCCPVKLCLLAGQFVPSLASCLHLLPLPWLCYVGDQLQFGFFLL